MSQPFLAEIRIFPYTFAPQGWALCNGQLLAISQNSALFSLLGTTYGGDGRSTFGLPNLEGAAPLGAGQGPGLSPRNLGQVGGETQVTLLASQLPQHTHGVTALASLGNQASPSVGTWAQTGGRGRPANSYSDATPDVTMNAAAVAQAGGSQPHNNMQPYLVFNFCIAMSGVFPAR